jgi:uncharacterized protein (TIGR01244 family)
MEKIIVNDRVSVSGQIELDDVEALAKDGVEILLCNRPDDESNGQPRFRDIASKAELFGIIALYIPFKSGEMQPEHIEEMALLLESGKHVHAYCRTGNRSLNLYASASAQNGKPTA